MQKLKVQRTLLLGLIVTLASAAPLACGDDDSNGTGTGAGAGGEAQTAGSSGSGGSSAHGGGGGTSGSAQAGQAGGADMGGADMGGADMGGAAGMIGHGMAGEAGMAGAAPVDQAALYQANLDAICTVEGGLDCSDTLTPAEEKQACLDSFAGLPDYAPNCVPQIRAYVACLAPMPAASYMCNTGAAYPTDTTCPDESAAMMSCFPQ